MWTWVDRFLPPALATGAADERQKARLTVLFAVVLASNGPLYGAVYAALGHPDMGLRTAIAGGVVLLALPVLRATGSTAWATHIVLAGLWAVNTLNAIGTGGYQSPGLLYYTVIPAFGMLLVGRGVAIGWTVFTGLTVIALLVRGDTTNQLTPTEDWWLHSSLPFTILPLHLLLVALFESAKQRMFHEVELARAAAQLANRQSRAVLDAVDQGLFMVGRDGRLLGEPSAAASRWFGAPTADGSVGAWLDRVDATAATWWTLGFDQLTDGMLPPELVLDQLRIELHRDGRVFVLHGRLVDGPDAWTQLLIVISDVTEAREAARADAANRELLSVLGHVNADRAGFLAFLDELEATVARAVDPATAPDDAFRAVHTVKGSASLYGLQGLVGVAHTIESQLVEEARGPGPEEAAALRDAHRETVFRLAPVVGRADVAMLELAEVRALATAIASGAPHDHLAVLVRRWTWASLDARLHGFARQTRALADRLAKRVEVHVDAPDLFEAPGALSGLWAAFGHLIRNSLDHGIEAPEARIAAGKPATGALRIEARCDDGALVLTVRDDGRGIAWDRVREKALAAELPHATPDDLVEALFTDGLSTAAEVSDVSGRGVGLAAVRQAARALGGTLTVASRRGEVTVFTFVIPAAGRVERLVARGLAVAA